MVRVRSAPSPTGSPHIGTAYNALFNYVFAKKCGGKFILRIEDTDRERYVPEAELEIFESLRWLGLEPDESPEKGGPFGPYRQSERLDIYKKYAEELVAKGAAYYCFCSKERLEELRRRSVAAHRPPMYDGHCRSLDLQVARERVSSGEPHVIRLKVPRQGTTKFRDLIRGEIEVENVVIDDQILLKSDGFPTYHLANVIDDHLMQITHIIRGEEWLSSVPKHVLLYQAFGWKVPVYAHTPLLRGKDHSKLSKRHGALPILDYRRRGFLPEALLNYVALLGWTHPEEKEFFDLEEMARRFELEDLNATAPVFDPEKLLWLNGRWIRELGLADLAARIGDYGEGYPRGYRETRMWKENLVEILKLIRERIKTLAEFGKTAGYFFEAPEVTLELFVQRGFTAEETRRMLKVATEIVGEGGLDRDQLERKFRAEAKKNGWKMGEFCMSARIAITGKTASPPLFESMAILGREETLSRLKRALTVLRR